MTTAFNVKSILYDGTNTIKIKNCPPGLKQKNCAGFQDDLLAYKEDLKYASRKYDKAIIVRVVR